MVRVAAAEAARCRSLWQQAGILHSQPMAFTVLASVPAHTRQLGLTVKDVHGKGFVTGFDKSLGYAAPGLTAGLQVGDHIIAMNGEIVFDLR